MTVPPKQQDGSRRRCTRCGYQPEQELVTSCPRCGEALEVPAACGDCLLQRSCARPQLAAQSAPQPGSQPSTHS